MHARTALIALAFGLTTVSPALGQELSIPWSTSDAGGGTLSAGPYTLSGTIGQTDAHAPLTAGPYTLTGGFWPGVQNASPCTADFNTDSLVNIFDILAFLDAWTDADPRTDLNGDSSTNIFDILVFLQIWNTGCP